MSRKPFNDSRCEADEDLMTLLRSENPRSDSRTWAADKDHLICQEAFEAEWDRRRPRKATAMPQAAYFTGQVKPTVEDDFFSPDDDTPAEDAILLV